MYIVDIANVTIQDMINSSKKCATNWGIDGYIINANGGPLAANPHFTFSKQKKDFQTINEKLIAAYPAPSDHHKDIKWDKANGKFLPGVRKSAIEQDAEFNKYKPSPITYSPVVKEKAKFIPFSKGEKINFLADAEYLGKVKPGVGKYEPSYKLTRSRSIEFKYYSPKDEKSNPEKLVLPDCAQYKVENADKIVYSSSKRFALCKV